MGFKRKAIKLARWVGARALLDLKRERADGELISRVHPYRRLISYIMPTRNGSVVYFDAQIDATALLEYLTQANAHFGADITHCLVAAGAIGLSETPKMNRFVSGRRLYQRKGRWITFSVKRKRKDRDAKVSAVKMEMLPSETFRALCERINAHIDVERSDEETYLDRELKLVNLLPRSALDASVKLLRWADFHNLLPHSFIRNDGMYTSMFIANLGSLGMGAGYHHLYEWGNCPLFMMAGQIEARPVVVNGEVVVRQILPIRFSYEERIDDGLNARFGIASAKRALEDPFTYFGCLADDGSDAVGLDRPPR